MSLTQRVNSKANVKNKTDKDLPFSPQLPVANRYEATSTASQTVINMNFSVDQSNTDAFLLYINGQLYRPGASHDYTFTSVAADGTSSQVTLNSPLSANLNIIAIKMGTKKESEFQTDNRFVQLYEYLGDGFQGYVNPNEFLITATTGAPAANQFYSSIVNRSSMTDLSQDLSGKFGNDRFPIQTAYALQNEFGANGETVFGVPNDTQNRIRFVGSWLNNNDSSGQYISTTATNDYIEVVFYGTTLSLLMVTAASQDFRATVDNGSEGANIAVSYSTILNARNTNPNTAITVVSGLTLGIHTVKIRNNAAAGLKISGIDFGVIQANIQMNPGVGYIQGKKMVLGAAALYAPTLGVTGTRGGRMLVYQNADGTIGRSFQATNASQLNLTSADHTNEEIARIQHWSELGANRSDDLSTLTISGSARAFTSDDGTTTIVGTIQRVPGAGKPDVISLQNNGDFFTYTFVGTGLDVQMYDTGSGGSDNYTYSIDGASATTWATSGNTAIRTTKVVSGLPYGTHTVRWNRVTAATFQPAIIKFIVYQPKTPALPSGAVESFAYNVFASYVANTTQGVETIGTGVLRKHATREVMYVGTWTAGIATNDIGGWQVYSNTASSYLQYSFFGTGFDLRMSSGGSNTWTLSVDGSTNLSGFTTSSYGLTSFVASTGVATYQASVQLATGISVSGLTLGWHTVKFTQTSGAANNDLVAFDIVTPIHSHKSNINYDQQNTLPVGSCSLSDNRKFSPVKDVGAQKANIVQAFGVTSNPTTTSTSNVPMPEMSVVHYNTSGKIEIFYAATLSTSATTNSYSCFIYIDGVLVPYSEQNMYPRASGENYVTSNCMVVNVSPGTHKIDVYWSTGSGTLTAVSALRNMSVKEIF